MHARHSAAFLITLHLLSITYMLHDVAKSEFATCLPKQTFPPILMRGFFIYFDGLSLSIASYASQKLAGVTESIRLCATSAFLSRGSKIDPYNLESIRSNSSKFINPFDQIHSSLVKISYFLHHPSKEGPSSNAS